MGRDSGSILVPRANGEDGDAGEDGEAGGVNLSVFSVFSAFSVLLVVNRSQIVLPDRRPTQHRDRREAALPVGGVEPLTHQSYLGFIEAQGRNLWGTVAEQDPMKDGVGAGVGDAEVAFVRLPLDQVGAGRLGDDDVRNPQVPGKRPDLSLEEVADGIYRRRIVGVPGEISQQALGLVSGAQ